jgi:hypothetical protein
VLRHQAVSGVAPDAAAIGSCCVFGGGCCVLVTMEMLTAAAQVLSCTALIIHVACSYSSSWPCPSCPCTRPSMQASPGLCRPLCSQAVRLECRGMRHHLPRALRWPGLPECQPLRVPDWLCSRRDDGRGRQPVRGGPGGGVQDAGEVFAGCMQEWVRACTLVCTMCLLSCAL